MNRQVLTVNRKVLTVNRKVKVLVCKLSSCFVEPSCSQPNRSATQSFSSTSWTAQVAI